MWYILYLGTEYLVCSLDSISSCFLFFTFLLASCWFATDDLPGLANCVTWYSFLFSLYIFIPSFSFLCFCFFNKGWCSRYSFQACFFFLFFSSVLFLSVSIFLMCFSKTDRFFLNSCLLPLLLKCTLANLPIHTFFYCLPSSFPRFDLLNAFPKKLEFDCSLHCKSRNAQCTMPQWASLSCKTSYFIYGHSGVLLNETF